MPKFQWASSSSRCFAETIGFDKYASFAKLPVLPFMKPGEITKEFQMHSTFGDLKLQTEIIKQNKVKVEAIR